MRSQLEIHAHSSAKNYLFRKNIRWAGAIAVAAVLLVASSPTAYAIGTKVDLGSASSYSVLGSASVTNTGKTVLSNDLGVSPGTAVSGFPPGITLGQKHITDTEASLARSDLTTAFISASNQATDETIGAELGGLEFLPGVYASPAAVELTGKVTLNAQGNPDAVFIFKIGSALVTHSSSSVELINGAEACNVFWVVNSSATLDTDTTFAGTIMALQSISAKTRATVQGRALARNGSVTLDTNVFTPGVCTAEVPSSSAPASSTPASSTPASASVSSSVSSTAPVIELSSTAAASGGPGSPVSASSTGVASAVAARSSIQAQSSVALGTPPLSNTSAQIMALPIAGAVAVAAAGLGLISASKKRRTTPR